MPKPSTKHYTPINKYRDSLPIKSKWHRLVMLSAVLTVLAGCAGLAEKPVEANSTLARMPSILESEKTLEPGFESRSMDPVFVSKLPVKPAAEKLFTAANEAIERENFQEAESFLLNLIDQHPEFSSARTNLALLFVSRGRTEEAIPLLEAAILIEPKDCIPRIQLGLIERGRHNFANAEQAYLDCLNEHPENATALINLGILYELYMGRFEDALAAYDRYQRSMNAPDQRVALWIANLSRRLKTMSQLASGEQYQ